MISHTALRYFAEVARCRSIRGAAERLHVAASAISRQISQLEEELNSQLLDRSKARKGLQLTPAGEVLVEFVKAIETDTHQLRSALDGLKGLKSGSVHLGITESFVRDFIPDVLQAFSRQHEGITFFVEVAGSPRLLDLVLADKLDVALVFNVPVLEGVEELIEILLPTRLLVKSDHPLARKAFVTLADIAEHRLAMPDSSISAKSLYDAMFAEARILPRPAVVTNSYELMRTVSMAGLSATIVNEHLSYRRKAATGYKYIPIKDKRVKPQRLTVCVRHGRKLPPAPAAFTEHLLQALRPLQLTGKQDS